MRIEANRFMSRQTGIDARATASRSRRIVGTPMHSARSFATL